MQTAKSIQLLVNAIGCSVLMLCGCNTSRPRNVVQPYELPNEAISISHSQLAGIPKSLIEAASKHLVLPASTPRSAFAVLKITTGENGGISSVAVASSSGHIAFNAALMKAFEMSRKEFTAGNAYPSIQFSVEFRPDGISHVAPSTPK